MCVSHETALPNYIIHNIIALTLYLEQLSTKSCSVLFIIFPPTKSHLNLLSWFLLEMENKGRTTPRVNWHNFIFLNLQDIILLLKLFLPSFKELPLKVRCLYMEGVMVNVFRFKNMYNDLCMHLKQSRPLKWKIYEMIQAPYSM